MLGKTHLSVGVATALVAFPPKTIPELVVGAGMAAVGALISDIDVDTSESHREANRITWLTAAVLILIAFLEYRFHLGIYKVWMKDSNTARIIGGCLAFIGICAFGKEQPHRSFMHSFLAGAILSACVEIVFPMAMPYFAAGFLSHLALDCLNRKRIRVFYPLKRGICLDLFKAGGFVNHMFFVLGSIISVLEIVTGFYVLIR